MSFELSEIPFNSCRTGISPVYPLTFSVPSLLPSMLFVFSEHEVREMLSVPVMLPETFTVALDRIEISFPLMEPPTETLPLRLISPSSDSTSCRIVPSLTEMSPSATTDLTVPPVMETEPPQSASPTVPPVTVSFPPSSTVTPFTEPALTVRLPEQFGASLSVTSVKLSGSHVLLQFEEEPIYVLVPCISIT